MAVVRPYGGKCTVRRRIGPQVPRRLVSVAVLSLSLFPVQYCYTMGFSFPPLPPRSRATAMAPSPFDPSTASSSMIIGTRTMSRRPPIARIAYDASSTAIDAAKRTRDDEDDASGKGTSSTGGAFKKSPGLIIVVPLVAIFGLDLIANIAVVTKRSLEVLFTGEYTVWMPWQ
jgi:hypothetical protein